MITGRGYVGRKSLPLAACEQVGRLFYEDGTWHTDCTICTRRGPTARMARSWCAHARFCRAKSSRGARSFPNWVLRSAVQWSARGIAGTALHRGDCSPQTPVFFRGGVRKRLIRLLSGGPLATTQLVSQLWIASIYIAKSEQNCATSINRALLTAWAGD
jgi:hypothetical protein